MRRQKNLRRTCHLRGRFFQIFVTFSRKNLRRKNCLLEIGASNLEGPLLKFQYSNYLFSMDAKMWRDSNFVPWKNEKTTLKSRILYQNCRNFQYCLKWKGLPRQLKTQITFIFILYLVQIFSLLAVCKWLQRLVLLHTNSKFVVQNSIAIWRASDCLFWFWKVMICR